MTSASSSDRQVVVAADEVSVVLGSRLILDAVDLHVRGGQSLALLGANGSGKSTLVRTILGLVPVVAGSVTLFGRDVTRRAHVPWDRVGYVPQRVAVGSGVPATAVWIDISPELALQRNRELPPETRLPESTVRHAFALYQLPSTEEGFADVQIVAADAPLNAS